jgi:hypothetical protein
MTPWHASQPALLIFSEGSLPKSLAKSSAMLLRMYEKSATVHLSHLHQANFLIIRHVRFI